MPRNSATCPGVLIDFKALRAAVAMFNFVLAPSDLETTSRIPAKSKIARTDPPAMIPVPAPAGLILTQAAPAVPIAACATVLPSIRGIVIKFLLAS